MLLLFGSLSWLPQGVWAGIKIVAAENFYGAVATDIAGKESTVVSILNNPNQDPHEFTTNASTARAVADADIVIYSGISYDPWIEKLIAVSSRAGRTVINVAETVGAKEGDNPHIWYKPSTMPQFAARLVQALCEKDPGRSQIYHQRLTDFDQSMEKVYRMADEIKKSSKGTTVTATEPIFGYMAESLGFKMINYDFQVKIMNDSEPSTEEIAAFERSLVTKEAKILFYNSQVSDPTTTRLQQIGLKAGIPVIGVTETQPLEFRSYVEWMVSELNSVRRVLPEVTASGRG